MWPNAVTNPERRRDEAEKPFWISYADMMTALTVLFLISMTVALLAVTQGLRKLEDLQKHRQQEIAVCLSRAGDLVRRYPGIRVLGNTIDFGTRATFGVDSAQLTPDQQSLLRRFVPQVVNIARTPQCDHWFKQIVVNGYASNSGTYIHNLHLSLARSERLLCVLLAPSPNLASRINDADRRFIRQYFLVGGSSFNALKRNAGDSQRIELRIEFLDPNQRKALPNQAPLDNDQICPVNV
jgi:hypothetical protein